MSVSCVLFYIPSVGDQNQEGWRLLVEEYIAKECMVKELKYEGVPITYKLWFNVE